MTDVIIVIHILGERILQCYIGPFSEFTIKNLYIIHINNF